MEVVTLETIDGYTLVLSNTVAQKVFSIVGLGKPPIDIKTSTAYDVDGSIVSRIRYNHRILSIGMADKLESPEILQEYYNRILDFLRHTRGGPIKIYYRLGEKTWFIYAYLQEMPGNLRDVDNASCVQKLVLTFLCYDPIWYGEFIEVEAEILPLQQWVYPAAYANYYGGANLSGNFDINYEGTYKTWPVLSVVGPATGIYIKNNTTGYFFGLDRINLLDGEELTAILGPYGVTLETDYDYYGNMVENAEPAYTTINPSGLDVPDGINNITINLSGIGTSSEIKMSYYERFEGIL